MGKLNEPKYVSSRFCAVCQSADRAEIERLILSISPSNPSLTLDSIAEAYGFSSRELRVHALMHSPIALDLSERSEVDLVQNFKDRSSSFATSDEQKETSTQQTSKSRERLTDSINMREGDMLLAGANEMLTTLTTLGRRIKHFATGAEDQQLVNFCTNAIVSLYVGTGAELRKSIDSLNQMNISINGAHDTASDGLIALAKAIRGNEGDEFDAASSNNATNDATNRSE